MATIWPEICLADLVRALSILHPDDDSQKHIASMLGFKLDKEIIEKSSLPSTPENPQRFLPNKESIKPQKPSANGDVLSNLPMKIIEEKVPIEVSIPEMPLPLKDDLEENEPLPEHIPLLVPTWTRAIFIKLLSVETDIGPPDILKLIKIISENKPLKQIPHKSYPTLRNGVQVLIDIGPGLVPYMRDQKSLLEQLKSIIGTDRVEVWKFIGTPLKYSFPQGDLFTSNYELPSQKTPILMLTDLGIATPPFTTKITSAEEWLKFALLVHEAGCPLFALTPYNSTRYESHRYPDTLKDQIKIIHWDRRTTLLTVSKLLSKNYR